MAADLSTMDLTSFMLEHYLARRPSKTSHSSPPTEAYEGDDHVSPHEAKLNRHLGNLRQWRNYKDRDYSLSFMNKDFEREVAKPFEQLKVISKLWEQHLPRHLLPLSKLVGFQRGVLQVEVSGSSQLYELEQLLRNGLLETLQNEMQRMRGGRLQRVKCKLGQF